MRIITYLVIVACLVACSSDSGYDFRSADRPSFEQTVSVAELVARNPRTLLLDVRLPEDYAADPELIPGAEYRNPEEISAWASGLSADTEVIVYCVRGQWVSQKVAHFLDERGIEVRSLDGGIEAWKALDSLRQR